MSDLMQLLSMLAIPAALFLICRFLNLRADKIAMTLDPPTTPGTKSATALTHWTFKA